MSIIDDDRTKLTQRNQLELLCFKLEENGTAFAINVFKVRETVKFTHLTLLPDAHEAVQGLLTLRKEIIPVVDLRKWILSDALIDPKTINEQETEETTLEQPAKNAELAEIADEKTQIIVCEFNQNTIGVKVFKAEYILRRNWEDIKVPISSEFGSKINNYTKNDDGDIVYIVDIESMLAEIFPYLIEEKLEETRNLERFDLADPHKIVLIAEDSKTALKALTIVLDRLGVKHKDFRNGKEIIDYIKSLEDISQIGLIITDLEMPITSGFTVIKEVKESQKTSSIPIIVNSSMTGDSNLKLAKSLNAQGFIGKTNPTEISKYLREFLGKK